MSKSSSSTSVDSNNSGPSRPSDKEIVAQFNQMKTELQTIMQKLGELEQEKEEHK